MLYTITLLTSLLFASTYPLCFWISYKQPIKDKFHHFHMGLPTIVGVITMIFILRMNPLPSLQFMAGLWIVLSIGITAFYWNKDCLNPVAATILTISGLCIAYQVQSVLISPGMIKFLLSVLGGLIFSAALFAMNLGHHYLNVHGLPIKHLKSATYTFWVLVSLRLILDVIILFGSTTVYQGDTIRIYQFVSRMDGFLLIVPVFFGTLFPFCSLFMVNEILKLKNTQAATGVLYVILCAVLLGDMAYKYYLIKFGIAL